MVGSSPRGKTRTKSSSTRPRTKVTWPTLTVPSQLLKYCTNPVATTGPIRVERPPTMTQITTWAA